ncbi:GMC family oxidoreductase [Alsobacter sp. R-9]
MPDLEADVVIVGTGPTGAAAAWRLATRGLSVLCIERGGWVEASAVPRTEPDFELRRRSAWHANPNVRRWGEDEPVDDTDSPIRPMVGHAVGGSSVWWSAHMPRFRAEDFRMRTLDGVGDDWPIDHEDLAPWFELNETEIGLGGVAGDPSAPLRRNPLRTLPTIGPCGRRFAAAFDRLGWHWWPVDLTLGRSEDGDEPCTHVGPCDVGCPARLRQSADRIYMRRALAAGARLLTRTRALELEHDRDGRVTALVCAGEEGRFRVRGSQFMLAANGMGTPRLLLLSRSGAWPEGLANRSGLVGRNLMLHPYAKVEGLFDGPLGSWTSGQKAGIISFEFFSTRPTHDFVRGFKLQLNFGPQPVALALGASLGSALPLGGAHHAEFERRFDRIAGISICAEDLPEAENRIALSERIMDRDGLPAPRMIYRLSENSRRSLDFGMARAGEVLREAGAGDLFHTPLQTDAGFHIMGTARMGTDPETSVVDPYGRCHDSDNLFVIDASVFVTSSSVNPTATAQAFALRAADHLADTSGGRAAA